MARIITIAEAYETMINEDKLSSLEAIEEIKKKTGKKFDPKLIDILIKFVSQKE